MKEAEATQGQKLRGLVLAHLLGESFAKGLSRVPDGAQEGFWEAAARTLGIAALEHHGLAQKAPGPPPAPTKGPLFASKVVVPAVPPDPDRPQPVPAPPGACCAMRVKIRLTPSVINERSCGVPDSAVADFMAGTESPEGRVVVAFRCCPWCGAAWKQLGEVWERPKPPPFDPPVGWKPVEGPPEDPA